MFFSTIDSSDPIKDKLCRRVFDKVLDEIIASAKEENPSFKDVYSKIYYGGSYFDGLKVKSTSFEYDVNVVFKKPPTSFKIRNLGDDQR